MAVSKPTAAQVKTVIQTSLSDTDIDAFMDDAVLIVEQCASIALGSEALQRSVVKWVTAHLINFAESNGGAISMKVLGSATEAYANSPLGEFLKGSTYGMQALMMDKTGCLAKLGQTRSFFEVL
jgi:hypothetical protein